MPSANRKSRQSFPVRRSIGFARSTYIFNTSMQHLKRLAWVKDSVAEGTLGQSALPFLLDWVEKQLGNSRGTIELNRGCLKSRAAFVACDAFGAECDSHGIAAPF